MKAKAGQTRVVRKPVFVPPVCATTSPKTRFGRLIEDKRFCLLSDDDGVGKAYLMRVGRSAFVAGWVARRPTGEVGGLTMPATPRMRAMARLAWEGK